ncbi:MAG TPA: LysE family transporter, partial [Candidatus Dormibacteraeota bacterium]|nr:LysE family transporter [Candidatus Dormibacteraeota bacterium]
LSRRPPSAEDAPAPSSRGLAWAYISTVGLTLTNPTTIVSFVALAASLGRSMPALIVAGVLVGSAAWWTIIAFGASWLRPRLAPGALRSISVFSGLAIVALGALAVYTAFA